jgi:hypothetical protein
MKQVIIISLVFAGLLFSGRSLGQRGSQNSNYNPGTVEVLKGEIMKIDTVNSGRRSSGIHILLKSGKENIPVHLGPGWFLSGQNFLLKIKDQVEVKGSRVTYNNAPAIIAAELKKGNQTLKLRNETGVPLWSRRAN